MGLMNTQAFPKQLSKEIDQMWMEEYTEYPTQYSKIAKQRTAPKGNRYTEAEITGLGLFQSLGEGQSVQFDTPEEGNEKTIRYVKAGLGFQVTEEMIEDEMFGKAKKMSGTLARSSIEYVEQIFWDLFNRGFDGTHTAKDGQPIFDTAHPLLKPLRGVSTISNEGTAADLSETSLAAGLEYFGQLVDERGMPINNESANYLIHTPGDTFAADRLHTQQYGGAYKTGGLISAAVSSSHNAVNPKTGFGKGQGNGAWTPMEIRWLTDDDAWFLLSPKADFRIYWKKKASLKRSDDFGTGNYLYKSVLRLAAWLYEWRYCYGNTGA
jgi:hypothetical protein